MQIMLSIILKNMEEMAVRSINAFDPSKKYPIFVIFQTPLFT